MHEPRLQARISIHAPQTGSDIVFEANFPIDSISIHAPQTGSDTIAPAMASRSGISIHAPQTGSDPRLPVLLPRQCYFNPRSPNGERPRRDRRALRPARFQSTLPKRGATSTDPHPLARDLISIHAPQTGSDIIRQLGRQTERFQSTLPKRGATYKYEDNITLISISIHAPQTGSDRRDMQSMHGIGDFNPRSPNGERHCTNRGEGWHLQFQSTLPKRGATALLALVSYTDLFQSTLPKRGATPPPAHCPLSA